MVRVAEAACPPAPGKTGAQCALSPKPSQAGRLKLYPHRVAMTCAQIATMPKNNASEAKAAASSANRRNIATLPSLRTKEEHSSYFVRVKREERSGTSRS